MSENIEKIKKSFVDYCLIQYEASLNGDSKTSNKMHKKIMSIYSKLKKNNIQDIVIEYINDENEGVRLCAAVFLLKTKTAIALECLKNLTNSNTIISLRAKLIMELWEENKMDLL